LQTFGVIGKIQSMTEERTFEIEFPTPQIRSIIVGKEGPGFKIDIHGVDPNERFEGGDSYQDRIASVVRILSNYLGPESKWVDWETRQPVHVWDAIVSLSELEEWGFGLDDHRD
jgi:hypothetical protein